MRLTTQQMQGICKIVKQIAGENARVWVFGSRLEDTAQGGDLDLMVELSDPVDNPALMSATVSTHVSRLMQGRKVDVLLYAPNLKRLAIHDIAFKEGKLL